MAITQIRRKGGLDKIKVNSHGTTLSPKLFNQTERKPGEDGQLEGDYRGRTFFNTKQFISPHWDDTKSQWCWGSNKEKLAELITKMKLRYPKGHPQAGSIIEVGNLDSRLGHHSDPIFTHSSLYGRYYMENGRVSLNDSDPAQEFLYYCYKGNKFDVEDKSSDEIVSKFVRAGTKFEIISPRKENLRKKTDASKEVRAITLLASMDGDEERMRAIAEVMDLPGCGGR